MTFVGFFRKKHGINLYIDNSCNHSLRVITSNRLWKYKREIESNESRYWIDTLVEWQSKSEVKIHCIVVIEHVQPMSPRFSNSLSLFSASFCIHSVLRECFVYIWVYDQSLLSFTDPLSEIFILKRSFTFDMYRGDFCIVLLTFSFSFVVIFNVRF